MCNNMKGSLIALVGGSTLAFMVFGISLAAPTIQTRDLSVQRQSSEIYACIFTCFAVAEQFIHPFVDGSLEFEVPSDGGNVTVTIGTVVDPDIDPSCCGLDVFEPDTQPPKFVPQPTVGMKAPVDPPKIRYPISGKTHKEVHDALQNTLQNAHPEIDFPAWGMTNLQHKAEPVVWSWGPISYIHWVGGSTDIQIVLPEWNENDKAQADKCQQRAWDKMIEALIAHENGHVAIAKQFSAVLKSELLKINKSNKYKPWEFDAKWSIAFAEALRITKAQHKEYDDKTDHGGNTGVKFDPCVGD